MILKCVLPLLDWQPNILQCNDWQTALIPFLLREKYESCESALGKARSAIVSDLEFFAKLLKISYDKNETNEIQKSHFAVPEVWDIGEVFERLIEDCYPEAEVIKGINEFYQSWITDKILNFNTDFYYQNREYLAMCYKEGTVLE